MQTTHERRLPTNIDYQQMVLHFHVNLQLDRTIYNISTKRYPVRTGIANSKQSHSTVTKAVNPLSDIQSEYKEISGTYRHS